MALGLLNFAQSDYLKAESVLNESLVIWRELDDRWWCAFVLNFLALITRVHDRDAASALFRESLETARATEDQWLTALSLWNSGENELNNKYLDEAQRQLEESLRLCNAVGDGLVKHEVLRTLGELAEVKGDYPQAVKLYEESLRIIKELDAPSISMLHLNLGRVLQLSGDNNEAAKHFTEEIKWTRQIGDQASLLRALQGLGVVAAAQGKAHRAVRLFVATEVLFAGLGYNFSFNPNETTWLERHLGRARAELGEDEFSTAKAEGQAMSLDQAVEYALEEI
jgi:tetratricopeptide (TPR) repeat protein